MINPISGTGGRPEVARQRIDLASRILAARGVGHRPLVTEYAGHARVLSRDARERGVPLVIAWGGDGTINEVASELVFSDVTLGIVPSGSGNGLASELGIPFEPAAAFAIAFDGRDRTIDAGELDGRLFFNLAGVGLDARIAHEFASNGLVRRGYRRYLEIGARELFAFTPDEHTIVTDDGMTRTAALIVAIANGRQYGNGALIAPGARLDDGRLDVVVIEARSPWRALCEAPMLFAGRITTLAGVTTTPSTRVQITAARPMLYHVDGEPFVGGAVIEARVRPQALRVRCAEPRYRMFAPPGRGVRV